MINNQIYNYLELEFNMWTFRKAEDVAAALKMVPHLEGGYFKETHRSGSTPMTTKGQTDFDVTTRYNCSRFPYQTLHSENNYESLTLAPGRESRRPDSDIRRNCITSIIWMPVLSHPKLPLGINLSDHVHYYHGGCPFEYTIYNPHTDELYTEVLGPDFTEGQKLQVPVPGGFWKCGRMINTGECDYTLIGEAVAPGFDFHDFSWVTESELECVKNEQDRADLLVYLHENADELSGNEVRDAEKYYDVI